MLKRTVGLLLVVTMLTSISIGQAVTEVSKHLELTEIKEGCQCGFKIDTDGSKALVTCWNVYSQVFVYKLVNGSWILEQELIPSTKHSYSIFGHLIQIINDTAVVSSSREEDKDGKDIGAIYIFKFNGKKWVETQTIKGHEFGSLERISKCVAFDGNTLVFSYFEYENKKSKNGTVKIFKENISGFWELRQSLSKASPYFGAEVDIHENTLLVGDCGYEDGELVEPGRAIIYEENNNGEWHESIELCDSYFASPEFGKKVQLEKNHAIISAYNGSVLNSFHKLGDQWVEGYTSDTIQLATNTFKRVLDLDNNRLAVSCSGKSQGKSTYIDVYEFSHEDWVLIDRLHSADKVKNDFFGYAVTISDNSILIGAYSADVDNLKDVGKVYSYTIK